MLPVTLISFISCCFINHEEENKRIHYSVNLTNKGNKTLSFFSLLFFSFSFFANIRHLIKKSSLHETRIMIRSLCLYKSLAKNEKSFLYIELHQTRCLYFPFLFPSSVLLSFFSFPASSLFRTKHHLTHPPVKSSTLPLRKMPIFQGIAQWQTNLTLSCVIPLWDSATAHSSSGEELNPSSHEDAHFSGRCTSAYNFHFILRYPSFGLSNNSLTLW